MQHGQFGHFLIYHVLPVVLIYGGLLGLIGLLTHFHKKKQGNSKSVKKKSAEVEIMRQARPIKRRGRKTR